MIATLYHPLAVLSKGRADLGKWEDVHDAGDDEALDST